MVPGISGSAINLPAWSDIGDEHELALIFNLIKNAKVADAHAEGAVHALQRLATGWPRIPGERINRALKSSALRGVGQAAKKFSRGFGEGYRVAHAAPV